MVKKPPAEMGDPREWLRTKLGEAEYADFEKGMCRGAQDAAKGKPSGKEADVEGQTPCSGYCASNCYNRAMQSGYWSWWFVRV